MSRGSNVIDASHRDSVVVEVGAHGHFKDLGECNGAYEKLWAKCMPPDVRKPPPKITASPKYDHDRPAEAVAPRRRIGDRVIGEADTVEAKPIYHPPEARTGVPNAETGWDYGEHGEDWSKLGHCGDRENQSPVDVAKYVDIQGQTKYMLWFDYYRDPDLRPTTRAELVNDGHGVRYDVPGNSVDLGFLKIGTQAYEVAEYVFHAPSEHTMDGAVFPLELQIYNREKGGNGIVAVSIFFREGQSNPFLSSLKEATGGVGPTWNLTHGKGFKQLSGRFSGAFDLEGVVPRGDAANEASFYNYEGSMTQPPCTPGVDWWVLSKPVAAARDEIKFIRKAVFKSASSRHGNARETQPLGDRRIFVGLSGTQDAVKVHNMPRWKHLDETKQPRGYSSQDKPWGTWNGGSHDNVERT